MPVYVIGLNELIRNLRRVSREYPREMKAIHGKIGDLVADDARSRVRSRSGRLARGVKNAPTQKQARLRATARDPRTGYDYARINHYGRPGWYEGNPFFDDAIDAKTDRVLDVYMAETDKFITKVMDSI